MKLLSKEVKNFLLKALPKAREKRTCREEGEAITAPSFTAHMLQGLGKFHWLKENLWRFFLGGGAGKERKKIEIWSKLYLLAFLKSWSFSACHKRLCISITRENTKNASPGYCISSILQCYSRERPARTPGWRCCMAVLRASFCGAQPRFEREGMRQWAPLHGHPYLGGGRQGWVWPSQTGVLLLSFS